MKPCNRRKFALGAMAAGAVGAFEAMTGSALAADERPAATGPVPGAVALTLDREIHLGASSQPIRLRGGEFSVLSVGKATFHLGDADQLTARLGAGVAQYAKADFRIYAAVYDAKGALLGTASHVESVDRVRLGAMPTMLARGGAGLRQIARLPPRRLRQRRREQSRFPASGELRSLLDRYR